MLQFYIVLTLSLCQQKANPITAGRAKVSSTLGCVACQCDLCIHHCMGFFGWMHTGGIDMWDVLTKLHHILLSCITLSAWANCSWNHVICCQSFCMSVHVCVCVCVCVCFKASLQESMLAVGQECFFGTVWLLVHGGTLMADNQNVTCEDQEQPKVINVIFNCFDISPSWSKRGTTSKHLTIAEALPNTPLKFWFLLYSFSGLFLLAVSYLKDGPYCALKLRAVVYCCFAYRGYYLLQLRQVM